jgi:quercetin dioxygenase-like cupin family protein
MLNFDAYVRDALQRGYDEVVVREWLPHQRVDTHSHPVSIEVVVASGEVDLTLAGQTRRYAQGEVFTVAQNEDHAETYGPEGAVFWVARRADSPPG